MNIFALTIVQWLIAIGAGGLLVIALLVLVVWGLRHYKRYPKSAKHKRYGCLLLDRIFR